MWTGRLRASVARLDENDGRLLEEWLIAQETHGELFPVDEDDYARFVAHQVRAASGLVAVSVPEESPPASVETPRRPAEVRESIKIQSILAKIGSEMGMRIWIPKADRGAVLGEWEPEDGALVDILPLNYDSTTIKTIEQIDVLWLKGRSIVRAFEVEHTTSIYSGILRMADLLALQPNLSIKLHIVAPSARRDRVFEEIRRPVFALLEKGPLSESCTYLSYESIEQISSERHLAHLSDTVLEEYSEEAE
jgi:hypothetical protein